MSEPTPSSTGPIAIIGAGSIGVSFAIVFARAGVPTRLYDPEANRREAVAHELRTKLEQLHTADLLTESPEEILSRIEVHSELSEALPGVVLVQECIPEVLPLKAELFTQVAALTPPECILASSSSALTASEIAGGALFANRLLVAHPGNPPHLIPVIELVPSPRTDADMLASATTIYRHCGLSPVHVREEIEGFIFNRLQGAILREAYALVRDGVASVEDVDTVMRDGLGRRWSFMGPFETVDLNTRGGIASHAQKMGPAYYRMGQERGQNDPWTPELVAQVVRQRREVLPLDAWAQRVAWRDGQLISALRRNTEQANFPRSDNYNGVNNT